MNIKFSIMNIMIVLSPIFTLGVYYYRDMPYLQMQVICMASITYLSLAVLHHIKDKTIHMDLILEYVFIAILILVVVNYIVI
jgi:hypothetical protein